MPNTTSRNLLRGALLTLAVIGAGVPVHGIGAQATTRETTETVRWSPLVEFAGDLFPSYVLATANLEAWEKSPREIAATEMSPSHTYVGDILGFLGASVLSPDAGHVMVEVRSPALMEGSSSVEADLRPNDTTELFPRIAYNYDALANFDQPKPANATVAVWLNGKLIGQKSVVIHVRAVNDIPIQVRMRDGQWLNQSSCPIANVSCVRNPPSQTA